MDYTKILFEKYQTALLTPKQLSEVLGRSVYALEKDRKAGIGVPFIKAGEKPNSPIRYPIHEVSKYLNRTNRGSER